MEFGANLFFKMIVWTDSIWWQHQWVFFVLHNSPIRFFSVLRFSPWSLGVNYFSKWQSGLRSIWWRHPWVLSVPDNSLIRILRNFCGFLLTRWPCESISLPKYPSRLAPYGYRAEGAFRSTAVAGYDHYFHLCRSLITPLWEQIKKQCYPIGLKPVFLWWEGAELSRTIII